MSSYTRGMCYTITPSCKSNHAPGGGRISVSQIAGEDDYAGRGESVSLVEGKSTHVTLTGGSRVMFHLTGRVG